MNKSNFEFESSAMEVKAGAFDIIAKYIHDVYGAMPTISNITSDEAFFVTVVTTAEDLLDAFRPREEF